MKAVGLDSPQGYFHCMKLIAITGRHKVKRKNVRTGEYVKVDDEDYVFLSQYKWNLWQRGILKYAVTTVPNENGGKRKTVKMHRMIMQVTDPKIKVDHKNGDGMDNQKLNLRFGTTSQNAMNKKAHKNRYKGVHIKKYGTRIVYVATCTKDGQSYRRARMTEEEAALAYNEMAKELFGEFAHLNVID